MRRDFGGQGREDSALWCIRAVAEWSDWLVAHQPDSVCAAKSTVTRAFYRAYPLNSDIQVVVREVAGDRISLTLPETLEQEREANRTETIHVKDDNDSSFGSLGDLFGGLDLK